MKEKNNKIEREVEPDEKMVWEAPKLISLDKGKTEGGVGQDTETFSYRTPSS